MRSALRLFCLLAALLPSGWVQACELRMAWKHDPPYQQEDAQGRMSGLELEIARGATARMGCKLRFVELPFARAMVELEGGQVDLVSGVLPQPERERYARFSLPLIPSRNIVFMRADLGPGIHTMDELRASDLRIGVERGVAYRAKLEALFARPGSQPRRVEESTSLEGLLQMLQKQRIDAFVADEYSAIALARQLHITTARATDIVINDEPSVFAFSRRSVDATIVERFNAALEIMKRDGSIRRLESQFLNLLPRHP